jgi:ABC-type dipeptide/oligopeptide/nickel transport system permease subunit
MSAVVDTTPVAVASGGRFRSARFLRSPQGIGGLVILVFVLAVALIGPLVAPHSLSAPVGVPGTPPSPGFPLGTDYLGRDVLSRLLHGGTSVLVISVIATGFTYLAGIAIGMTAGLSRSIVDPVLMRMVDVFLVFPPLMLLLLLIAGAGTGVGILILGIVLVLFPGVARIVRTATLEVSTTAYIEAAVARGERTLSIMRREVLPNITPAIIADVGVRFSAVIILAASVNFLGLGAKPPAANWGLMIAENLQIVSSNIWSVLAPAIMLALLTISVNLIGDAYVRSLGRAEPTR